MPGASSSIAAELASSSFQRGTVGRPSQRLSPPSFPGMKFGIHFNLIIIIFCKCRMLLSFFFFFLLGSLWMAAPMFGDNVGDMWQNKMLVSKQVGNEAKEEQTMVPMSPSRTYP